MRTNGFSVLLGLAVLSGLGVGFDGGQVQARGGAQAIKPPAAVQGRWMFTEVSSTNYYSGSAQYVGNGNANGMIYNFDSKGNFRCFVVVNMRLYSSETKINNDFSGKATFTADTVTLRATSGTFRTETDGRLKTHPASRKELASASGTYHWHIARGEDGKPRLVLVGENGAMTVLQRF